MSNLHSKIPRAWWRQSVIEGCWPCVTVDPEEASIWRAEGLHVVELATAHDEVLAEVVEALRSIEAHEGATEWIKAVCFANRQKAAALLRGGEEVGNG